MLKNFSVVILALMVSGSLISCSNLSKDNSEVTKTNDDIKLVNNIDYNVDIQETNDINTSIQETNDINAFITQISTEANGNSTILLGIENLSEKEFIYGQDFILQKKVYEQWVTVNPIKEKVSRAILYILRANNIAYEMIPLDCYGTLDEGDYRLIKEFNSNGIVVNKSMDFSMPKFDDR